MSKFMDEQLKLAQKVVDLVDHSDRKIWCVLDEPEGSNDQVQFFEDKKKKFP